MAPAPPPTSSRSTRGPPRDRAAGDLPAPGRPDDGVSLAELIVAIMVFGVVLTVVTTTFISLDEGHGAGTRSSTPTPVSPRTA